eukprot:COSAG02_NODE_15617_length_1155_cov_1.122159_2_plen_122_part_01
MLIEVAAAISVELIPLLLHLSSKSFVEQVPSAELLVRPPIDELIERNSSTAVSIHWLKELSRQRLLLLIAVLLRVRARLTAGRHGLVVCGLGISSGVYCLDKAWKLQKQSHHRWQRIKKLAL